MSQFAISTARSTSASATVSLSPDARGGTAHGISAAGGGAGMGEGGIAVTDALQDAVRKAINMVGYLGTIFSFD